MKKAAFTFQQPIFFTNPGWQDYGLLDSGNGRKLERFGGILLDRPEAEAIWQPALPAREWQRADAVFHATAEESGGHWEYRHSLPEKWEVTCGSLHFWMQTTASRHVGLFPEQAPQWEWIIQRVKEADRQVRILNLFGYTGAASLAAAAAGAKVTHVDASRKVVGWAKENSLASRLPETAIRWIVDDAVKFVQREARRGSFYDGVILDPPKFGRGPKGEVWEFYRLIPQLLQYCQAVLSEQPLFLMMTAYAVKASYLTLYNAVSEVMQRYKGMVQAGEILNVEQSAGRLLSTAIYALWSDSQPPSGGKL
ncbi:MAG: class I SAM-dependent methyltransferase [bacterium]